MLSYGCTRLEIGLQSTYEDVARDTNRGHTVAAVGECFRLAKNAGFKVGLLSSIKHGRQGPERALFCGRNWQAGQCDAVTVDVMHRLVLF